MSHSLRAAKAVCRDMNTDRRCACGVAPATRGQIQCRPCSACARMMHSVYDEEAHWRHRVLAGQRV